MGFDLYGIKPIIKAGSTKPAEIDFDKSTEKERTLYFEQQAKYENANVGIYFRNNVWWWRPLADLVVKLCKLLDEKQKEHLHDNSGYEYDEATAKYIADTLEAFVKSPVAKRTEKEHKKAMKKAEVHNKKVQVKLEALRKDAIAQTGNKNIAPRDYPKELNDKWEHIYSLTDHIESYPFSLKNVKEFIAFLRECGGFRVC